MTPTTEIQQKPLSERSTASSLEESESSADTMIGRLIDSVAAGPQRNLNQDWQDISNSLDIQQLEDMVSDMKTIKSHQMTEEMRSLRWKWFYGLTCRKFIWIEDLPGTDYVLIHHNSHGSKLDIFGNRGNCGVYHVPARKDMDGKGYVMASELPQRVNGRLFDSKKAALIEWCKSQSKEIKS